MSESKSLAHYLDAWGFDACNTIFLDALAKGPFAKIERAGRKAGKSDEAIAAEVAAYDPRKPLKPAKVPKAVKAAKALGKDALLALIEEIKAEENAAVVVDNSEATG